MFENVNVTPRSVLDIQRSQDYEEARIVKVDSNKGSEKVKKRILKKKQKTTPYSIQHSEAELDLSDTEEQDDESIENYGDSESDSFGGNRIVAKKIRVLKQLLKKIRIDLECYKDQTLETFNEVKDSIV